MGYFDIKGYFRGNSEDGYDDKGAFRYLGEGGYDGKGIFRYPPDKWASFN